MGVLTAAASAMPASGIREISHLAIDQPAGSVVRLELGEPGARTAPHVVEAAVRASQGRTGYTPSAGTAELRAAVAARLSARYGLSDDPTRVVLGQGAVQLLSALFAATVGPGDEVLVPDPGWPNYAMQVQLYGARPVPYPLRPAAGFRPDPVELERLISGRTKVLVLNSPANPTGAVLPPELADQLVALAARHDVLVFSDEVYDEIVYDGGHTCLAAADPLRVISVFSFSKTYAMTGWRVGYASLPPWLAETIAKLQEAFLSSLPTASQAAALAAMEGPQAAVATNLAAYRAHRDLALDRLAPAGIEPVPPAGAFYLMVPLAAGVDSRSAALDLVRHGVAMAPGSAFGRQAADQLRISLASEPAELALGLDRFVDWYARTRGGRALGPAETQT